MGGRRREPADVTLILRRLGADGAEVNDDILLVVYRELKQMAEMRLLRERRGHSLAATDLVHEAYLRLVGDAPVTWENRAHFFGAAAEAMRRILVEHARRRGAGKRGGGCERVELSESAGATCDRAAEIVAVHEALSRMEAEDPRAASVVKLRFFAGLDEDATARALGLSPRTVRREWMYARARMFRDLGS